MLKRYIFVALPIFCFVFLQVNISLAEPAASPETEVLSFGKTTIIGHLNFPPLIYANESGESIGPGGIIGKASAQPLPLFLW